MKLEKRGTKFIWVGGFETRMLPKGAGFRWNPDAREWWTDDAGKAAKLAQYADEPLKAVLQPIAEKREKVLESSRAATSDMEIPAPAGLQYLPFQKAGISYMLMKFGFDFSSLTLYNRNRESIYANRGIQENTRTDGDSEVQSSMWSESKNQGSSNKEVTGKCGTPRMAGDDISEDFSRVDSRGKTTPQISHTENTTSLRGEFQGRQRTGTNQSSQGVTGWIHTIGIPERVCYSNEGADNQVQTTDELQGGLRKPNIENGNRVGRAIPSQQGAKVSGRKEEFSSSKPRLAGYENQAQVGGVLLADEPGLGKTIQAIGVMNSDITIKATLVICTASLKLNWKREIEKWSVQTRKVSVISSTVLPQDGADTYIINFDILEKYDGFIRSRMWDLMVVDEAHFLKNPKAKRTQQVLGYKDKKTSTEILPIPARRKIFMTGTPVVNRPVELWPLLSALAPEQFSNFFGYAKRYCDAVKSGYGWDFSGASHLDELQEKLRLTLMVRRLKKDVLPELPTKWRQVIEISANGLSGLVKREQQMEEERSEKLAELQAAVELAKASDDPEEYQEAVKALREGAQVAFTEMAAVRHEIALAKVPYMVDHIKEALGM